MTVAESKKTSLAEGGLLCVFSGAGFGTLLIFGKLAYQNGFSLSGSLAWRFVGASVLLGAWILYRGTWRGSPRLVASALLLGIIGYTGQSAFFFGAMTRIGVSLTSLLLYTYPSMVTIILWVFKKQRPRPLRIVALLLSLFGCALTVHASSAPFDPYGIALGLAAPLWYAFYLTFGSLLVKTMPPITASTYICVGAGFAFSLASALDRSFTIPVTSTGWFVVLGLVVVSTVMPMVFLFEGMKRVGAARASILSSIELVVTVLLGTSFLDEKLSPLQILGAVLVLAAVLIVQARPEQA